MKTVRFKGMYGLAGAVSIGVGQVRVQGREEIPSGPWVTLPPGLPAPVLVQAYPGAAGCLGDLYPGGKGVPQLLHVGDDQYLLELVLD